MEILDNVAYSCKKCCYMVNHTTIFKRADYIVERQEILLVEAMRTKFSLAVKLVIQSFSRSLKITKPNATTLSKNRKIVSVFH